MSLVPAKTYYEQANPDLLYRIPVTANSILEIGCGSGGLGKAYKGINPTSTYIGVEVMPAPASEARKVLDHVIEADINREFNIKLPDTISQVDCLVFGDVLEHLVNPHAVVSALLPLLKDQGQLIACIPNAQHWTVIANLLSGHWPQEEQGIFDKTHLRWFTLNSIRKLMQDNNLIIQDITPRIFDIKNAKTFVSSLAPSMPNLNLSPQKLLEGVAPLQYVVRASKIPHKNITISGLMLQPQAGMNDVRMIQPLRSLSSIPGVQLTLSSDQLSLSTTESPKIMIWQRQLLTYESSIEQIQKVIKAGYVLISEFDDDPEHWPTISQNKYLNFTGVHAVQTSTEILAQKLKEFNPEVAVFENAIEKMPFIESDKWTNIGATKPLKIFFGALNRKDDWKKWMPYLNKLTARYSHKIQFEVIHDQEFYNELDARHKNFKPTCNYSEYIKELSACHISLLPLNPTSFNECKSDLKLVESAGCNTAALASPTVYNDSMNDMNIAAICRDGEEMSTMLEGWINDPEEAKKIADKALTWCENLRLQKYQTEKRLEWYMSLWNRRDELTKDLLQRIPELKD